MFDPRSGLIGSAIRALRTLATRFAYKSESEAWGQVMSEVGRRGSYAWPDFGKYAQQAAWYTISPWVYVAVSKIAESAAQIDLHVKQIVDGKAKPLPNHAINQLLRRPNTWQSQFELIAATFGFLELNGNAYWFLDGGADGGQPTQIMALRPDRLRIVSGPDTQTYVLGYVYVIDGREIPLAAEEVLHFKRWHPFDDFYGLSAMEAAAVAIQTDDQMGRYNRNFFGKHNASPAGIVSLPPTIGNAQFELVKRDWQENYGSGQRRVAFIRAGEVDYKMAGLSQKDMDFLLGRKFEKEAIYELFGLHVGMMSENSTEANAKVGYELFTSQTLWPKMLAFAQKLTSGLAQRYGDDLEIAPEDIRVRDRAAERADLQAVAPFMTINEVRVQKLDLPALEEEWAKVPVVGVGAASLTGQPFGGSSNLIGMEAQLSRDVPPAKAIAAEIVVPYISRTRASRDELEQFAKFAAKRADGDADFYASQIERFAFKHTPLPLQIAAKAWADVCHADPESLAIMATKAASGIRPAAERVDLNGQADPLAKPKVKIAKRLQQHMLDYLTGLRKRVIAIVRNVNAVKDLPDYQAFLARLDVAFWSSEFDELTQAVFGVLQDAVEMAGREQADQLRFSTGISFDPALFNIHAARWAQTHIDSVLKKFGTTTQDGTAAIIARWTGTPGATIGDLVAALEEAYLFSGERAAIVGETEITRAFASGAWLGAAEIADAAGVDMSADMDTAGEYIPAHVRCFCWWTPHLVYDDQDRIVGMDMLWKTNNSDNVCAICAPRHDKLLSEIIAEGL